MSICCGLARTQITYLDLSAFKTLQNLILTDSVCSNSSCQAWGAAWVCLDLLAGRRHPLSSRTLLPLRRELRLGCISVCMLHLHTCVYIYTYIITHTFLFTYIYIYLHIYIYTYTCTNKHAHIYIYIHNTHTHIYMHTHTYIYIYNYIYI